MAGSAAYERRDFTLAAELLARSLLPQLDARARSRSGELSQTPSHAPNASARDVAAG